MAETDIVLQELENDIRQERLRVLWRKFGSAIIGFSVAVIVVTLVVVLWQNWQDKKRTEYTGRLIEASKLADAKQYDESVKAFAELAADSGGNLGALAALRQGEVLWVAGKKEEAAKAFASVADMHGVDDALRDNASLWLLSTNSSADKNDDLLEGPFKGTARERVALAAVHAKDYDRARTLLTELKEDQDMPASLRARAREWLSAVPASQAKPKE